LRPGGSADAQKTLFRRFVTANSATFVPQNWKVYTMNADGSGGF
jgi:hypothetical protein